MSSWNRWFRMLAMAAAMPASALLADDAPDSRVTFTKDIQAIFQRSCQECHRPAGTNFGGIVAPMSLTTYEEVRPWAKSISKVVQDRTMPPWHAAPEQDGLFRNQRTLTADEIAKVVKWANSGAPMGDPADAPPPADWPTGEWVIGEPDLILTLDDPFFVEDDIVDLNIDLPVKLTKEILPENRYVTAIEFKPGSDVVHHIIGYVVPGTSDFKPNSEDNNPESSVSDNKEEEEGEDRRGGFHMIGGIAPGTDPDRTPPGYGMLLETDSTFVFQMHYNKEKGPGTGKYDRSQVAFKFAPKDEKLNPLFYQAVGDTDRLKVPANDPNYRIVSTKTYDRSITIVSYLPHMHLRGVYSKYVAHYPDGTNETLLETPKWSFNWQTSYKYKEPKVLPAGTKVEVTMGYDNSANNPANPNPNTEVVWGAPTYMEMNLGWMCWAYTEPTENDATPQSIGGGN